MFKKNKKLIFIIIAVIIILIVILANIYNHSKRQKFIKSETERVLQYSSINDFKSLEEVCLYLDTELISKEESKIENVDYEIKVKLKYNLEYDKKNYFENLIQYSAYALGYKNFYIIDENKQINIFVLCNSEKQIVSTYYINDIEMYFEKQGSKEQLNNYSKTTITQAEAKSDVLKRIISNNWNTSRLDLGTVDSHYKNYDIYFDEGYEIKKINGKVFNVVFTEKYKDEVLDGITIETSKEQIQKTLGKPTFETNDVLGYKTEKFYIFFSDEQISVYPVVSYDTSSIIDIIRDYNENRDFEKYINKIRETWDDYDMLENSSNKVIIRYTLKGITFKYDTTSKRGIVINNNYKGKINETNTLEQFEDNKDIKLMENMYFENVDSVFENEKSRIYALDDYSNFGNVNTSRILNISNKYKVNQKPEGKVMLISINKQAPNVELRENASYAIWYDDETLIYSVKGKGIYMFDVSSQKYTTIVEGADEYKIGGLTSNKMLYYDKTSIHIEK